MADTLYCSFCGKSQHEVRKLIAGPMVFICDECTELCMSIIREEHNVFDVRSRGALPTAADIRKALDGRIEGQDHVKRLLTVILREHYRGRAESPDRCGAATVPSTVLFTGSSTACREFARVLGRFLDAPMAAVDATQLIDLRGEQETLEEILLLLLEETDFNLERAQQGFVFIEHLDQLGHLARNPRKDLSERGRQVQQGIVRLMTGTVVDVSTVPDRPVNLDTGSLGVFCAGTFPGLVIPDDDPARQSDQELEADDDRPDRLAVLPRLSEAERQSLVEFGLLPDLVERLSVYLALEPIEPAEKLPR